MLAYLNVYYQYIPVEKVFVIFAFYFNDLNSTVFLNRPTKIKFRHAKLENRTVLQKDNPAMSMGALREKNRLLAQ